MSRGFRRRYRLLLSVLVVLATAVSIGAFAWRDGWLRPLKDHITAVSPAEKNANISHADDAHGEHASIEISPAGRKNIGYEPAVVELGDFTRTISLPAVVVERPGQSQLHVVAPLTGIVTRIYAGEGEAVEPGEVLFEMRLTHEELVAAQRELLRTAESLDVVTREIARLKSLGEGVVAGRRVLEQEYEQQKLQASLKAERQALLLHGLSIEQVDTIQSNREMFREIEVRAPPHTQHDEQGCEQDHPLHIMQMEVMRGQQVEAGAELCLLADHCKLYVEGRAFEDDVEALRQAASQGWEIAAQLLVGDKAIGQVGGLKLLYLSDRVGFESRAFRFYLRLPNEIVLDQTTSDGRRFVEWRYKPGQRMNLQVPVERWQQEIVLPRSAIVEAGAEMYVFRQNGRRFERVPVHVKYRDQDSAVVANDGTLFPGDVVAVKGAYQMNIALENQSGDAADPHAGHSH